MHSFALRSGLLVVSLVGLAGGCNLDLGDLVGGGDTGDTDGETDGDTESMGMDSGDGGDGGNALSISGGGGGDDGDSGGDGASAGDGGSAADSTGGGGEIDGDLLGLWAGEVDGVGIGFGFYDDGSYEQATVLQGDQDGCTIVIQEYYVGTYVVDGDTLELTPAQGEQHIDQCGEVTDSTDVIDPSAWTWSIAVDDVGEALTMTSGDSALVLYRSEGG